MRSHHLRAAGGGSSLPIEESGLDIYLDANDSNSYSGSGTTWTNLSTSGNFGNATLKTSSGWSVYTSSGSPKYFTDLRAFIPNPTNSSYYPLTYSIWVYPTGLSGYDTVIDQGNDNFYFGFGGDDLITYNPTITAIYSLSTNTWYNFTVTYTLGQNLKYYQDAVLKYTHIATGSGYSGTFSDWSFGDGEVSSSYTGGSEPFEGRVGAIMVYNRPLTATEVTSNYNALKSTYGHP